MGQGVMFYLSDDNREEFLKLDNRSKTINELLREHFKKNSSVNLTPEEREKKLKILKIQLESMQKIEDIQNG